MTFLDKNNKLTNTHFHTILVYKVTYCTIGLYVCAHNIMTEKNTKYQKLFVGSQKNIARQTLKVWTRQEHLSTAYLATVVPLFSDSGVWKKSPEDETIKKTKYKTLISCQILDIIKTLQQTEQRILML